MVMRVSLSSRLPPPADSHGGDVLSGESVRGVADEKAGLAHGSERQEVRGDGGHGPCPGRWEVSRSPSPTLREDPAPPLRASVSPPVNAKISGPKPESQGSSRLCVKGWASGSCLRDSEPWCGTGLGICVFNKLFQVTPTWDS